MRTKVLKECSFLDAINYLKNSNEDRLKVVDAHKGGFNVATIGDVLAEK